MPIPIPMAVAIYFTTWWIVLFAVLPWGVRSQEEARDVVPGSDPGAPTLPRAARQGACGRPRSAAVVFVFILVLFALE